MGISLLISTSLTAIKKVQSETHGEDSAQLR